MEKSAVIEFFDKCAATWDAEMIKSDVIIGKILDNAEIKEGMDVLDVACGTGVLFPYYVARGVNSVTGIDISPEMARICAEKFKDNEHIQVICGDVEELCCEGKFDRIVVYNAFPHFPNPKRLIKKLAALLKEDGRLTIAHGASRETIDGHHKGAASKVSNGLMSADKLKKLFDPYFDVEIMISNSQMYQVSGLRRNPLGTVAANAVEHSHDELKHAHLRGDVQHEHSCSEQAVSLETVAEEIRQIIQHNDSQAQQLAELAHSFQLAGEYAGYDALMDTAADFDIINAKLDALINKLT